MQYANTMMTPPSKLSSGETLDLASVLVLLCINASHWRHDRTTHWEDAVVCTSMRETSRVGELMISQMSCCPGGTKAYTVDSLCKDTRCKDNLDVSTTTLVTNHCLPTAVVPLSKDNAM